VKKGDFKKHAKKEGLLMIRLDVDSKHYEGDFPIGYAKYECAADPKKGMLVVEAIKMLVTGSPPDDLIAAAEALREDMAKQKAAMEAGGDLRKAEDS
jgi:hypothetical protein